MDKSNKNPQSPDENNTDSSTEKPSNQVESGRNTDTELATLPDNIETFRELFNSLINLSASSIEAEDDSQTTLSATPKDKIKEAYIQQKLTTEDLVALLYAPLVVLEEFFGSPRSTDFGFHTINDPKGKLRFFHLRKLGEGGMNFVTKCFAYPIGKPKDGFIAVASIPKHTDSIFSRFDKKKIIKRTQESRVQIAFGRALLRYMADRGLTNKDMLNIGLLPPIAMDSTPGSETIVHPLITPRQGRKYIDFYSERVDLPTLELLLCLKKYAETLHFLNSNSISHPDLKEENLFYGYVNGELYPLIGDLTLIDPFNEKTKIQEYLFCNNGDDDSRFFGYSTTLQPAGIARTPILAKFENEALRSISTLKEVQGSPPDEISGNITAQVNLASFNEILRDSIRLHLARHGENMQDTPEGKIVLGIIKKGTEAISKLIMISNDRMERFSELAYGAYIAGEPYHYNKKDFNQLLTFADVAKLLGAMIGKINNIQTKKKISPSK